MAIEMSDVLKSGDIDDIVLGNNIQFVQASGAEAQNTFMRIGSGGLISLYRAPDQDIVWSGDNTFSIPLSTTEQTLVGMTITENTAALDGSFNLSGSVTNQSHQDSIMTLSVYDDDLFVGSENMTIKAGDTNKLFLFSGGLYADIAQDSVMTARFTAADNNELTLNGAVTATTFTIIKAQAAPVDALTPNSVGSLMADNDFSRVLTTSSNLGTTLSRVEIDGVLIAAGITLDRNITFKIRDANDRMFLVTYMNDTDKYYYERLTEATE